MTKLNEQIIEKSKDLHKKSLENNKELMDKSAQLSKSAIQKSAILNIVFGIAMILGGTAGLLWLSVNTYLSVGLIILGGLTLMLHILKLKKDKKAKQ